MSVNVLLTFLPAKVAMTAVLVLYAVAHLIAWGIIPAPKVGATGVWPQVFKVLNTLSANYMKAENIPALADAEPPKPAA